MPDSDHELADESFLNEKGPDRRCLVTGSVLPKEAMLRFVMSPDGGVAFDVRESLPGRGAWVVSSRGCVVEACRKQVFSKGFKRKLKVDDALPDKVRALLEAQFLAQLGLARRTGNLYLGADQVQPLVAKHQVGLLVIASDVAPAQRSKWPEASELNAPLVELIDRNALSRAVGGENTVYLAVKSSIVPALAKAAKRLIAYENA
ncbi:DUF448 domain-containing protein [bacterium]|nr:DUF448 domain-containing protein [bacterium]